MHVQLCTFHYTGVNRKNGIHAYNTVENHPHMVAGAANIVHCPHVLSDELFIHITKRKGIPYKPENT